ncbi:peptidase M4 family protein [Jeotgalibacillus sp. S-D1]|uniref:M4 family metallopeptidase n=1 Tax=Jeotgalibacillus sp. S-D1 TaxID=2552189 RepID=UPI00105A5C05|nr:M4 family metallopeptidase [Jeotgalibacillus sp. S-D1]TDL31923.1 peptidase M4 family protein [Jeotgalibacillus sp. S-D1]
MKKHFVIPMVLTASLVASSLAAPSASAITASESENLQTITSIKGDKSKPVFVTGLQSQNFSKTDAANAVNFLEKNKGKLGLANPKTNLKETITEKDELGMTHVRLQQTKNGIPVEGAEVIVHYSDEGSVDSVSGYYNNDAEAAYLNTTASLSKNEAVTLAKKSVNAPGVLEYDPVTDLVVYPFNGKQYTAYKVNVNFLGKEPGNWFVYIDAKSGKVIDQYNGLMHVEDARATKGSGTGVKGEHRNLHIAHKNFKGKTGSTFYLKDISHPGLKAISTYDFKNEWGSEDFDLPGVLYSKKSAAFNDEYDKPAVDAHYNSEKVYEYFLNEHGRNSIDGEGMEIISTVHFGEDYNNAFWNGRQMTYGDGDGLFFIPLSASLDVAAHEMTHGVTTNTAGLLYRNESGALNEAFSDIFGALVDEDDWEVGEDAMGQDAIDSGRPSLRSLSEPDKYPVGAAYKDYGDGRGMYPKHMNEFYNLPLNLDNGGVHINSSIINHAAYLTGEMIGKEKLGKVYYRALTVYLTPNSNFKDARKALIQSAEDLYGAGSAEAKATEDGLNGVGITE